MMKNTFSLAFAAIILGCGGGGGGGGGTAATATAAATEATPSLIQSLIENVNGGYREVSNFAADNESGSSNSCGTESFPDQITLEKSLLASGGSINSNTSVEWCGKLGGESNCIKKNGDTFFIDSRSPQGNNIIFYMTGLLSDHMTVVDFDSTKMLAEVATRSKDLSVTNGSSCSNSGQPTQVKESINGNWVGYKATYFPGTMTGSTVAATASCVNQSCTISGATNISFTLSDFNNAISWRTAPMAQKLAGATISSDQKLLSMFVCSTPLDEGSTLENCEFFTFKNAALINATNAVDSQANIADSGKYTCSTISHTLALELFAQGHTYLDRDHDGRPCEASDISAETNAIISTPSTPSTPSTTSSTTPSSGQCYVNGYYKKNGTHVNGYYRSC